MKNLYLRLIFLSILNFSSYAQIKSNYERGFEIGLKEGYCYNQNKYNCLAPMTPFIPYPRLNESSENYTEGYNRGFQYGLDLRRSDDALRNSDIALNQKVVSFNQYIPQNPVEAKRIVGMIKQKKYEARTEWMQQKIYQLAGLYETLFNEQNFPKDFNTYTHKSKLRTVMADYFDDIKAYDFGDDYVFQNVQQNIYNIEKYYYDYYNFVVSQIRPKAKKETLAVSNPNNNYSNKEYNENTKFSSIFEKYYGKYSCDINKYELVNNKYILKETKSGEFKLEESFIMFGRYYFEHMRNFLSETLDNYTKECTYKTDFGDVVIDYDFSKITFYEMNNKNYYVYIIKSKI